MRIALVIALALAAGCAKKNAAKTTPANAAPAEAAPGGTKSDATGGAPDSTSDEDTMKGDPCDGGETKKK